MKNLIILLALFLSACGTLPMGAESPTDLGSGTWYGNLSAEEGANASELTISWTAPEEAVDHYIVSFLDEENSEKTMEAPGTETSATMTELQPETLYTIRVLACRSGMCMDPLKSEAIYKKTTTFP